MKHYVDLYAKDMEGNIDIADDSSISNNIPNTPNTPNTPRMPRWVNEDEDDYVHYDYEYIDESGSDEENNEIEHD
jgi:hypothetical protein